MSFSITQWQVWTLHLETLEEGSRTGEALCPISLPVVLFLEGLVGFLEMTTISLDSNMRSLKILLEEEDSLPNTIPVLEFPHKGLSLVIDPLPPVWNFMNDFVSCGHYFGQLFIRMIKKWPFKKSDA